jgi:hypothetical protein
LSSTSMCASARKSSMSTRVQSAKLLTARVTNSRWATSSSLT